MKKDLRKRKGFVKAVFLLILSFVILTVNYRSNKNSWIESIVVALFSPIQKGVSTFIRTSSNTIERYFFLVGVEQKVLELEKDNNMLTFENNQLRERMLKYQRLGTLFNIKDTFDYKDLLLADVIGFDASGWSRMLIIDKGTADSIKKNSAVITHKGLIGRAVVPMGNYSKVLLITDVRSSVDALIQRSRARGVVIGTNKGYCEIKYLSINSDVKMGDRVISSGMGGTIQKGLLIGTISEVSSEKGGLFRKVKLMPSSHINSLEEVFVVIKSDSANWKE